MKGSARIRSSKFILRTAAVLSGFFFFSCVSLHTPSPHFVPSITGKGQFEGEVSAGLRSANVNFAYSPFQKFTVMGNVQGLPLNPSGGKYQRNCELALGTYGSRTRLIYGINGGYGIGVYNWDYEQFNDTTTYSMYTRGNFQKLMLQSFIALTDGNEKPSWLAGFSVKGNFYWDQYASLRYTTHHNELRGLEQNLSVEPCFFARKFFSKHFSMNLQAGINLSYDRTMFWPGQYVFTRLGVGYRL